MAHARQLAAVLASRLIVEPLADHAEQRGVPTPAASTTNRGTTGTHAVVIDLDLHVIDGRVGREPEAHDRARQNAVSQILPQLVEHAAGLTTTSPSIT